MLLRGVRALTVIIVACVITSLPVSAQETRVEDASLPLPAEDVVQPAVPAACASPTSPLPAISVCPEIPVTERAVVRSNTFTLSAGRIYGTEGGECIQAEDHVQFITPNATFCASMAMYNTRTRAGTLDNVTGEMAPFYFSADSMAVDERGQKDIRDVTLTTCNKDCPHYQIAARNIFVYANDDFVIRHPSLHIRDYRLRFPISRIRGNLGTGNKTDISGPAVSPGLSGTDGLYIEGRYVTDVGVSSTLAAAARVGTKGIVRGIATLDTRYALSRPDVTGTVSLITSVNELVENRLVAVDEVLDERLDDLSINRLPAVQATVDPIRLSAPLQGWRVRLGTGYGRYEENPTDVTENRAQVWGILGSRKYLLGRSALAFGEYGVLAARYGNGDAQTTQVLQLTLERTPDPNYYYNITYLRRRATGETPFLFDSVLVPDELYTEVELPITRNKRWAVNARQRYDLDRGRIWDYRVTLFHRLDCLSGGLYYDWGSESVGVVFTINAFGDFRKGVSGIGFTQ